MIDYEKVELLVKVFTKHEIVGYVVTQVISNMSKKELRTSEKKESDISLLGLLEKHGMTYKRDKKRVFFGMGHVVHWNHKKKRFVVGNLCEATLSEMTFIELQKELSIIAPVPENPRSSKRLHRRNTSTVRIAPVKK